ncbi:MAG: replication-associated recombination protein A [Deltaproteobacteria bacterium]|nr:replication-associated recombination protein A [Deltaproteobacteria bacterium]
MDWLFDPDQVAKKSSKVAGDSSVERKGAVPLAERMRPRRLDEYFGQEALVGVGSPLRRAIEEDRIHSFVLWGPPGTGKTTLGRIVAEHTGREFIPLSAVMSGVKDIKESVARAKELLQISGRKTILFIDEIHRFNKSQQDALLPFVEDGTLTLIGATTENPSFELNSALLSRAPVFVLKPLTEEDILAIMDRAMIDAARGLASFGARLPALWLREIARMSNGDARKGLTLLENAVEYVHSIRNFNFAMFETESEESRAFLQKALGTKILRYDAKGEEHYNTISAFIKSMRDSDPDAALYYLARMLESGEDPLFVARRMVVFASEDVGNADPRALQVAVSVRDAVDFVGMPEARINLAQGVTFLACAPKSNASYMGVEEALSDARELGNLEIPLHIRNAPTRLMKGLGYGKGYKYAHSQEAGFSGMSNLPAEIKNKRYYEPKDSGLEKQIRERLDQLCKSRK